MFIFAVFTLLFLCVLQTSKGFSIYFMKVFYSPNIKDSCSGHWRISSVFCLSQCLPFLSAIQQAISPTWHCHNLYRTNSTILPFNSLQKACLFFILWEVLFLYLGEERHIKLAQQHKTPQSTLNIVLRTIVHLHIRWQYHGTLIYIIHTPTECLPETMIFTIHRALKYFIKCHHGDCSDW